MSFALDAPVLLVGAGNMGGALVEGWLERGLDPRLLYVQDPSPPAQTADLLNKYDVNLSASAALPAPPGVLVVAVKPQMMDGVLAELKAQVSADTMVLSIAAGRTVGAISNQLGDDCAIIRAMPNMPAAIGRGITAAFANAHVSDAQKSVCGNLLMAAGELVWLETEADMDAVTAISGSGPAYVFYLTECLAAAGVAAGLTEALAAKLARVTISGSGALLDKSDLPAAILRENVTSPGGTTEAALKVLMSDKGLEPLLDEAVKAAKTRAGMLSS